jgi:hypothetical protein
MNRTTPFLELTMKSIIPHESLAATDATPIVFTMVDNRGQEYIVKFFVRNEVLKSVYKSLSYLNPVKKIIDNADGRGPHPRKSTYSTTPGVSTSSTPGNITVNGK